MRWRQEPGGGWSERMSCSNDAVNIVPGWNRIGSCGCFILINGLNEQVVAIVNRSKFRMSPQYFIHNTLVRYMKSQDQSCFWGIDMLRYGFLKFPFSVMMPARTKNSRAVASLFPCSSLDSRSAFMIASILFSSIFPGYDQSSSPSPKSARPTMQKTTLHA